MLSLWKRRCRLVNHPHHHHREAQHQHCSIYVRLVIIVGRIRVDRERLTWIVWVYWTWITSIIVAVVWAGEIEVAAAREASDIWPSVSSHRRVISSCLRPISRTPRLLMISSIRRELSLSRPPFFRLRQLPSSTMTWVIFVYNPFSDDEFEFWGKYIYRFIEQVFIIMTTFIERTKKANFSEFFWYRYTESFYVSSRTNSCRSFLISFFFFSI